MGEEMKTPELNELSTSVFKLKYSKLQSRSKLSAPIGAWNCNFLLNKEIMTAKSTNHQLTDMRGQREVTFP